MVQYSLVQGSLNMVMLDSTSQLLQGSILIEVDMGSFSHVRGPATEQVPLIRTIRLPLDEPNMLMVCIQRGVEVAAVGQLRIPQSMTVANLEDLRGNCRRLTVFCHCDRPAGMKLQARRS